MLNAAREVKKAGELSERDKVNPPKGSSSKSVISILELTKAKLARGGSFSSPPAGEAMPIVEEAKKIIPDSKYGGPDFSKVCLLSSMHLLDNTLPVFKTGFERGLKPGNVVAVGKIYSDYAPAKNELLTVGVHVIDSPRWKTLYGFEDSFDSACRDACSTFQKTLTADSIPIVVDDGGRLSKALSDSIYDKDVILKRCVIIEQTTSGEQALEACSSNPRIKLCSAFIKNKAEPPLVAECTVANLKDIIEKFRSSRPDYAKFTSFSEASFGVVGAGNIGKAIIKELVKQGVSEILVYDNDRKKLEEAVALGRPFERSMDDSVTETQEEKSSKQTEIDGMDSAFAVMQNCEIFIGATGDSSFTLGDVKKTYLVSKPVIAVSASSRQADLFPFLQYCHTLMAKSFSKHQKSYAPDIDINKPLLLKNGYKGKGILAFLRYGTPITFNNGPHAMPPKHAQLTRLLIIGSELQALEIAKEKLEVEFKGGTFNNLDFKLSPLWQLYTSVSFFEKLGKEKEAFFTESELKEMMDINIINKNSEGNLYYPFELKLREWLKDWLKEHKLTEQVDKWLKESEPKPSVAVTPVESLRLTA